MDEVGNNVFTCLFEVRYFADHFVVKTIQSIRTIKENHDKVFQKHIFPSWAELTAAAAQLISGTSHFIEEIGASLGRV